MSTFNISDSDDSVAVESITDPVISDAITDFKRGLDDTRMVTRGSVLALEELIGINIITSALSSNLFTEVPSGAGVEPLSKALTGIIANIKDIGDITIDSLYEKTARTLSMINHLKFIAKKLNEVPQDVIERMTNEKYIMTYDENDKLADINDINILRTLSWNNQYTSIIFCPEHINAVKELIGDEENGIPTIPLKLLSAIKDGKLNMYNIQKTQYDMITQGDILELIQGAKFLENVTNLSNSLSDYMLDIKKDWIFYEANIKELTTEVRRINMIMDFLGDKLSVGILQIYAEAKMNI